MENERGTVISKENTEQPISGTIFVLDPNDIYRQGIISELQYHHYSAFGFSDLNDLKNGVEKQQPDLIIIDVNISHQYNKAREEGLGIKYIQEIINDRKSSFGVIFFTYSENHLMEIENIFKTGLGGVGYLSKETNISPIGLVPHVLAGFWVCILTKQKSLNTKSDDILLMGFPEQQKNMIIQASQNISILSKAEFNTLLLIGKKNYAIAHEFGLSLAGVEGRWKNIYQILGLDQVDRRLRPIIAARALSLWRLSNNDEYPGNREKID